MLTLAEIFSRRINADITDNDLPKIVSLYRDKHISFFDIANEFKTHRRVIQRIVKAHLTDEEYTKAKSECYSHSVNSTERKENQIATQQATVRTKIEAGWVHPMKNPDIARYATLKRSTNTDYRPEKNFGSCARSNNGRYVSLDGSTIDEIKRHFDANVSLSAIGKLTHTNIGKVKRTILEMRWMTTEELTLRSRKIVQSFPERFFADELDKQRVSYQYQFVISGTRKLYDFYVPHINTLVELDSLEWHDEQYCVERGFSPSHIARVKRNVTNDLCKTTLAQENGFKLVRITDLSIDNLVMFANIISRSCEQTS